MATSGCVIPPFLGSEAMSVPIPAEATLVMCLVFTDGILGALLCLVVFFRGPKKLFHVV